MAKGTFLAHNVAWAVLGEKMNHRSQASANSNSGAWPFSATAASNYVTAITSAKQRAPVASKRRGRVVWVFLR